MRTKPPLVSLVKMCNVNTMTQRPGAAVARCLIETDRLRLRRWHAADLHFLDAVLGDPDVMEFSDHGVLNKEDQAAWLQCALAGKNPEWGIGTLAIERKEDGQIIGYFSLSSDTKRVKQGEAELGFRLARHAWGQGYATEAAIGTIEALRTFPAPDRIVAIVDPKNHRSVHVLKKIDMTYERDIMFEGYDYPDHFYARDLRA